MWNEHLGYVLTCPSNLGKFLTSGPVRSTRPQNFLGINQISRNWYPRWCPLQTRQPFKTRSIRRNLDQAQTPKERNWWCWYRCRRWCKYFKLKRKMFDSFQAFWDTNFLCVMKSILGFRHFQRWQTWILWSSINTNGYRWCSILSEDGKEAWSRRKDWRWMWPSSTKINKIWFLINRGSTDQDARLGLWILDSHCVIILPMLYLTLLLYISINNPCG